METTPIEEFVKSLAGSIRAELKGIETLPEFYFDISISGRVHTGELKIEFRLGENTWTNNVKGGALRPVIVEFMRRYGWDRANAPLQLTYDGVAAAPSEAA